MRKGIILRFITMPMAATIFQQDKEYFALSKIKSIDNNLIDKALDKLKRDFNKLKADMYAKYHLDVKYLGRNNGMVRYSVNKEVIEFTAEELRNKTGELMKEYFIKYNL